MKSHKGALEILSQYFLYFICWYGISWYWFFWLFWYFLVWIISVLINQQEPEKKLVPEIRTKKSVVSTSDQEGDLEPKISTRKQPKKWGRRPQTLLPNPPLLDLSNSKTVKCDLAKTLTWSWRRGELSAHYYWLKKRNIMIISKFFGTNHRHFQKIYNYYT